jgi:Beta-lactamase superfamily domain
LPGLTLGPKRLTASALTIRDLPKIDIVLLSHAHFDHFDMRTLHRFHRSTTVITAQRTSDLLRWTRFRDVSELRWKERKSVSTSAGRSISPRSASNIGARGRGATPIAVTTATFSREITVVSFSAARHRAERFVCGVARFRSHRFGNHADRRLQSLDTFALHSGTGRAHGQ